MVNSCIQNQSFLESVAKSLKEGEWLWNRPAMLQFSKGNERGTGSGEGEADGDSRE